MKQYTECERQLAKILLASQIQTLDGLFFFFLFFLTLNVIEYLITTLNAFTLSKLYVLF